jgi:4-amino-4-deoxy-L-arabinose transferase-like glycosyltransferase
MTSTLEEIRIPIQKQNHLHLYIHLAGVFLASSIIILVFWAVLPDRYQQNESSDYLYYYEPVARNVLRGAGFVQGDETPAVSNPPGYSLFLAGIFGLAAALRMPEDLVSSVFVLSCMGLTTVMIFLTSRKQWGLRGAWLSALFFITYPFVLWLTKQPSSEVPFMFFFFTGLYLFSLVSLHDTHHAGSLLFLSGLLIGMAMLFRGIALGSGILLFLLFLILKRNVPAWPRLLLAGMILLGNLVAVLPWQVWVYRQTDQVVLLGTNGVPSIRDGLTFAVNTKGYRQSFGISEDVSALQDQLLTETGSLDSVSQILDAVRTHLQQEPLTVLKLIGIKMLRSWYGTDSGSMETGIAFIQILYLCVVIISSVLLWKHRLEHRGLLLLVWSFAFYFWGMTTMVLSILRYMTPVVGLFALLIPAIFYLPKLDLHRSQVR